jgi:predicted nucleic acid-binding protein
MKVIFDTSILIDSLRGYRRASELIESVARREVEGVISVITEAEIYAGKDCNTEKGFNAAKDLISIFEKIILHNEIAVQAGEYRRMYGIEVPDAIIAATAFKERAKIYTKNVEDFREIERIEVEEPY